MVIILLFLILVILIYYFNSLIKTDNNSVKEVSNLKQVKSFNWIALIIVIGGLLCLFSIWFT